MEQQVEKYRDVLQSISKKVSPPNSISGQDPVAREKRLKKIHEYLLGQAMEDSAKELPDGNSFLFKKILDYCGKNRQTKVPITRIMMNLLRVAQVNIITINDLFQS